MLSSYFYVSQVLRQTYIETMQPRPFEEWIEIFMKLFLSFFVNYDHVTERTQTRPFEDNPRGATKEAPICAVPKHAPQTNSLWQGVGEVSSAGELGC